MKVLSFRVYGICLIACIAFITYAAPEEHNAASQVIIITIERGIESSKPSVDTMMYKLESPSRINRMLLKARLRSKTVEGIYATYHGWYTISDYQGRITFPRKHAQPSITLIVTRGLVPILIDDNLVHHFIVDETESVAAYQFDYIEQPHGKPHWHITKKPLSADRTVPVDAVVILAKPEHIYVPEGTFEAIKSPHLILPTIYARGQLTPNINALNFTDINRFFSPVEFAWRFAKARYAFMITE